MKLKGDHCTKHSVVVYAETLYEAVIKGLNRLSDVGWQSNGETISQVQVEIHQEATLHTVDVPKLIKWVKEDGNHPAQQTRKEKLRKLLGAKK